MTRKLTNHSRETEEIACFATRLAQKIPTTSGRAARSACARLLDTIVTPYVHEAVGAHAHAVVERGVQESGARVKHYGTTYVGALLEFDQTQRRVFASTRYNVSRENKILNI